MDGNGHGVFMVDHRHLQLRDRFTFILSLNFHPSSGTARCRLHRGDVLRAPGPHSGP
jgi:hypothetical protein